MRRRDMSEAVSWFCFPGLCANIHAWLSVQRYVCVRKFYRVCFYDLSSGTNVTEVLRVFFVSWHFYFGVGFFFRLHALFFFVLMGRKLRLNWWILRMEDYFLYCYVRIFNLICISKGEIKNSYNYISYRFRRKIYNFHR